jgi:hypothetical protein
LGFRSASSILELTAETAAFKFQLAEGHRQLDKDPKCDAANHWRNEISAWQSEIDRLRLRLPGGR